MKLSFTVVPSVLVFAFGCCNTMPEPCVLAGQAEQARIALVSYPTSLQFDFNCNGVVDAADIGDALAADRVCQVIERDCGEAP